MGLPNFIEGEGSRWTWIKTQNTRARIPIWPCLGKGSAVHTLFYLFSQFICELFSWTIVSISYVMIIYFINDFFVRWCRKGSSIWSKGCNISRTSYLFGQLRMLERMMTNLYKLRGCWTNWRIEITVLHPFLPNYFVRSTVLRGVCWVAELKGYFLQRIYFFLGSNCLVNLEHLYCCRKQSRLNSDKPLHFSGFTSSLFWNNQGLLRHCPHF